VDAIFAGDEVPEQWKGYIQENADFFKSGQGCTCHPK
jgi:hypothetical protein